MESPDKGQIIRDVGGMLQNLADDNPVEIQVKLNAMYDYIFNLWQKGYDEAQKTAWIKIKN